MKIECANFTCGNVRLGDAYDKTRDCRACWNAAHRAKVATGIGREAVPVAPLKAPAKPRAAKPNTKTALPTYPCIHRGEPTGERVLCGSCGGGVKLPVLSCAVKGRCVVAKPPKEPGIQCCRDCKERAEPTNELRTDGRASSSADDDVLLLLRPDGVRVRRTDGDPRLLLSGNYLERDGSPRILLNLATALRGWRVGAHSPVDGPLRAEYEAAGIEVHIGDVPPLTHVDLLVANTIVAAKGPESAVRLARTANIPCVWLIHESDPGMCGNVDDVRELIGYPAAVVFPCQTTADAYRGLPKHRAKVIPSIIPPVPERTTPRPNDGKFRVLTFGRDEERKGQQDIRAAVADLHSVSFDAISGSDNPHEWMQAADLYVCSSRLEAFPLSLQEAKAYRLPVITTPVFGCSGIIRDGIDGLHYTPGDVADLRSKIERIRTDAELRARLSHPLTHLPTFAESIRQYSDAFDAAIMPRVVYHVAGLGPWWKAVVAEQLQQLRDAGLTTISCTHVGEGLEWLQDKAAAMGLTLTIAYHSDDVRQWECPAMRLVGRLAAVDERPILYLHSKGVSHDPDAEGLYHRWRQVMMRELVEKWREHVPKLKTSDAVGVNWWTKPVSLNHFSGNFWLVRPSWIRRLPRFDGYFRDRYSCERWIGATPGCRAVSLWCKDKRLWDVHARMLD